MPGFKGARRGTTGQRGYGAEHVKARAEAFAALPDGAPCVRCGKPMRKHAKDRQGRSALHYDHNDRRDGYLGFSCAGCNRRAGAAAGGRASQRKKRAHTPQPWTSRVW